MLKLYSYFRSSTSYRARIALNLKGMEYETVPVNLLKDEQRSEDYLKINPMGGVPALIDGDFVLSQSLAIINYIDNMKSEPSLAPGDYKDQAFVRQIALSIAEDIHPLINLKTQKYLSDHLGADEAAKKEWYIHWTTTGMAAVEKMIAGYGKAGNFVLGNKVSVADICLIPNMYSMRRFGVPLDAYPLCCAIERHCITLPEFIKAAPETQAEAPEDLEQIHGPNAPFLKQAA
ncbi:MAG TPA: maleylacetoacetate isomerase [Micavibrio sp.]|nr:maleylacetoacetate isomerase [Micavibrio sp.]HIL29342.1 maleylacetoacetate isomerase [Micavibrio sp.]